MDTEQEILKLKRELESLTKVVFANNFASSQDFNKTSRFNTMMKVPHYTSAPSVDDNGYLIEIGGKLYISTGVDTFTIVGTQS